MRPPSGCQSLNVDADKYNQNNESKKKKEEKKKKKEEETQLSLICRYYPLGP